MPQDSSAVRPTNGLYLFYLYLARNGIRIPNYLTRSPVTIPTILFRFLKSMKQVM